MRQPIPFLGPDYASRSSNVNAQRTLNLWPKFEKPGAKTAIALYGTPGLTRLGVAGTGPWRSNLVEFGGALYGVSGSTLYKLNSNFSPTSIGTLSTSGGRVSIVAGRTDMMLVDGTAGYSYDGTTFATIADADFPNGATHCSYIGGYFVANEPSSDAFYISAAEDPTSWGGLDFASAEASPDNIDAHIATLNTLYLAGSKTTQAFYVSGNASFPLDPYPQGIIEFGIQAPHSMAKAAAGLFWLATAEEGGIAVIQVNGFSGKVISDDIAWDLEQMTTTSDATGLVYRIDNRTIYQISFPTEDKTFEYLVEDGTWVERNTYGYGRYLATGHGYLNNTHIMTDFESGNFYSVDFDTYTDNSLSKPWMRRSQHQQAGNNNSIICHELVVEFESGVGLATGQGSDPQVMLRYSDDGGHTWSNELWRSAGQIGERKRRVRWSKLGKFRNRIWEISGTDPVKWVITDAHANVTVCAN